MTDRWKQADDRLDWIRRALPHVTLTDRTPIDVPVVHQPDSVVWTASGDGQRRAWHVAGDGSLHETPESVQWTLERATERAARGQR